MTAASAFLPLSLCVLTVSDTRTSANDMAKNMAYSMA